MANVNSLAAIQFECVLSEVVGANGRDEDDVAAGPPCSHRLVCPLAAGSRGEAAAQDRLTWRGKARQSHRHIRVTGTDNYDSWHLGELSLDHRQ
jgi:hypothetical protein